jgi:Ca-activated chloride channel family protein
MGAAVNSISNRWVRAIRCLGFLAVLGVPAVVASDPSMLFILDASGSMWGRAGGEPKIVSAKSTLLDLVKGTPDHIQVGLMTYGHRKKGDCSDIELITPPGGERDAIIHRIDNINPKGKTPIGASLTLAGEQLAAGEDETTLVLVSDGLETCGSDPCATARQLREQGHKLVIHVVGFDVGLEATEQLQCIAQAGAGSYFAADNADALRDALIQVQTSVVEAKPVPAPPAQPEVPDVTSKSKRIRIAGPGKIRLKPAAWVQMPPDHWSLQDVETGEVKGRNTSNEVRAKAGEYQIVWQQSQHGHSEVSLTEVVTVRSGKTSDVPLETGLRITVPNGVEPPYLWGLAEAGSDEPLFSIRHSLEPQLVPAGDYELIWHQVEHGSVRINLGPVRIEYGKLNELVLDQGILLQPADWMGDVRPYYYRLLNDEEEVVGSWSTQGPQLVAPGDYTLVYRPTEHRHREIRWGRVTVPEQGLATVALDSGVFFIHDQDAKPPYGVYLVNLDSEREIAMSNTWDPLPVPPGRYRLDLWETQHGSQRESLVEELRIESGTLLELEM